MLDTELDTLPRLIADAAEPLPHIDDPAFGAMFDRFGDPRVVCLGEASHGTSDERFLLDLREGELGRDIREGWMEPRLERLIGVIYRPETERWSHYSDCTLPRQFDAWVWFDETTAVTPLPGEQRPGEEETYPFGL